MNASGNWHLSVRKRGVCSVKSSAARCLFDFWGGARCRVAKINKRGTCTFQLSSTLDMLRKETYDGARSQARVTSMYSIYTPPKPAQCKLYSIKKPLSSIRRPRRDCSGALWDHARQTVGRQQPLAYLLPLNFPILTIANGAASPMKIIATAFEFELVSTTPEMVSRS